jgi:type IV secretory pathway VirB6-like protein
VDILSVLVCSIMGLKALASPFVVSCATVNNLWFQIQIAVQAVMWQQQNSYLSAFIGFLSCGDS